MPLPYKIATAFCRYWHVKLPLTGIRPTAFLHLYDSNPFSEYAEGMITNVILLLLSLALTIWVVCLGCLRGWTINWWVLLGLGLLNIAARLDAMRRLKRKQITDKHSVIEGREST